MSFWIEIFIWLIQNKSAFHPIENFGYDTRSLLPGSGLLIGFSHSGESQLPENQKAHQWYDRVEKEGFESFNTVSRTIQKPIPHHIELP
jgi:hypothetical protein